MLGNDGVFDGVSLVEIGQYVIIFLDQFRRLFILRFKIRRLSDRSFYMCSISWFIVGIFIFILIFGLEFEPDSFLDFLNDILSLRAGIL